ncbi:MAG: hypothetical protein JXR90_06230 [Spirochaetes bacterium]|nr:hypothetical protein [Spirochaetota bacterium]
MTATILEKAFQNQLIDEKTLKFCNRKGIITFSDLKDFLLKEKPAYGPKASERKGVVYDLFCFALSNWVIPPEYINKSMAEILFVERASVRSCNVVEGAGFGNLSSFLDFFMKKGSFIKLRSCGVKANSELTFIGLKYLMTDRISPDSDIRDDKAEIIAIPDFNAVDMSSVNENVVYALNSYLLKRIHSLSVRTKNVFRDYLDFPLNLLSYHNKVVKDFKRFSCLKNVGKASRLEVNILNSELEYLYLNLLDKETSREEADFLQFCMICKNLYGIEDIPESVGSDFKEKKFKFFRFFDFIVSRILPANQERVLRHYAKFNFYIESENKNLNDLGKEMGISRQRVDQLSDAVLNDLKITLINLSYFFKYSSLYYLKREDIIVFDGIMAEEINLSEFVNFKDNFYSFAFSLFFEKDFVLYSTNLNSGRNITFMINKRLSSNFNFEGFIREIEVEQKKKINKAQKEKISKFMDHFISVTSDEIFNSIKKVCVKIISQCYHNVEIEGETIIFHINSKQKREDIVIKIIQEAGRLMSAEEIFKEFRTIYPDSTINSLRSTIINSERIKYLRGGYDNGTHSLYGTEEILKNSDTVEGTARSVAYQFLESKKQPCHIDDIYDFVKEKRPNIDKENLYTNLRLDTLNITAMPFSFLCLNSVYPQFSTKKEYPKQLQIYGKAYIHKTNCSYGDLLKYLCNKYDLEIGFVKLVFDRLIANGTILSTSRTNKKGILKLSDKEIERMSNMKRKFI